MSRIKVGEQTLGPLIDGGPQYKLETWHEMLEEGDAEPLSIEIEIPFSVWTRPIK